MLAGHSDVAECAVFGAADALKGQAPIGLLVLKAGCDSAPEAVVRQVVARVREQVGPVAAFKKACIVERLPKTRSGKILRGVMQRMADGEPFAVPATIDDPAILDEIREALRGLGLAGGS